MSIFREIEKKLETVFEGFFSQQFKSRLQPVEIAKKISALIDDERQIGPVHTYVPNQFNIFLSFTDYRLTEGLHKKLKAELKEYIQSYVDQNNYSLPGPPGLEILTNETLDTGQFLVTALFAEKPPTVNLDATQMLDSEELDQLTTEAYLKNLKTKAMLKLVGETVSLGRSKNNDIVIGDPSVSRYHAKIQRKGQSFLLFDLNSTNGTYVNEQKIKEARLNDGDVITFGQTSFVFQNR